MNQSEPDIKTVAQHGVRAADLAWLQIHAADNADAKALAEWKAAKKAHRDQAHDILAKAIYNLHFNTLSNERREVVSSVLAHHGDDIEKALEAVARENRAHGLGPVSPLAPPPATRHPLPESPMEQPR